MSSDSIHITCPTRIDLAGGTLDIWPIYALLEQAYTLNFAIDIYTHVTLSKHLDKVINLNITDLSYQKSFLSLEDLLISKDKETFLIKKVLKHFKPTFGFDLKTSSMSPIGGGLGGSSSLLIGLLEAFEKALGEKQDLLSRIRLARNIEAGFLGQPTGTQDYFAPALKSGTFIISYNWNDISYQHINTHPTIKEKCVLIYTGKAHHSGWNNWKVLKDFINGDPATKTALEQIAKVSKQMRLKVLDQSLENLEDLFEEDFSARMSLTKAFSSPEIEDLKKDLPSCSKLKICGAGGGGCVMVWTNKRQPVIEICQEKGYQVLNAQPL